MIQMVVTVNVIIAHDQFSVWYRMQLLWKWFTIWHLWLWSSISILQNDMWTFICVLKWTWKNIEACMTSQFVCWRWRALVIDLQGPSTTFWMKLVSPFLRKGKHVESFHLPLCMNALGFLNELSCRLQLWLNIWTKWKWENHSLTGLWLESTLTIISVWVRAHLSVPNQTLLLFHFLTAASCWILQTYFRINLCSKVWKWWNAK